MTPQSAGDTPTFEEALARLEAVVRALEAGEGTLEQSLALFQEGIGLARHCQRALDAAEARVEALLSGTGEEIRTAPYTPPGSDV